MFNQPSPKPFRSQMGLTALTMLPYLKGINVTSASISARASL